MNQDEFNEDERRSKQRIEAVYQELQRHREKVLTRKWVKLTDEEIKDLMESYSGINPNLFMFAKHVQDKLKERNT
jgi:hypothetical protein